MRLHKGRRIGKISEEKELGMWIYEYQYDAVKARSDYVEMAFERQVHDLLQNGPLVEHVKNGKPLTEHGAKLLGVAFGGSA